MLVKLQVGHILFKRCKVVYDIEGNGYMSYGEDNSLITRFCWWFVINVYIRISGDINIVDDGYEAFDLDELYKDYDEFRSEID